MSNATPADDLLTPAQAGAIVGKSDETMRRWAAEKKVRHVRTPSGRILFHAADLSDLFEVVEPDTAGAS